MLRAAGLLSLVAACAQPVAATAPANPAALGKIAFADPRLSEPAGQACADCHSATSAFRDPEADHSTSMGVVAGRFGSRNSMSAMYAAQVPPLHFDPTEHQLSGGLFWDGRADSLEDQVSGPLLNPLEMNNADKASVVAKLRFADYADEFRATFGDDALDDIDAAYGHLTTALAAFERTPAFSPFSSKYDHYLAGTVALTASEKRGLAIFEDPARGNCASCHPSEPAADGSPPMFTNYGYANLGVPRYANNLFFVQPATFNPEGAAFRDRGLGRTTADPAHDGKFRTPTLRNIARTAPYGHNGYFNNLRYFIDFLNTRDIGSASVGTCSRSPATPDAACAWPAPETAATMDRHIGNLHLSDEDVDDLVAFLGTLTDP